MAEDGDMRSRSRASLLRLGLLGLLALRLVVAPAAFAQTTSAGPQTPADPSSDEMLPDSELPGRDLPDNDLSDGEQPDDDLPDGSLPDQELPSGEGR
jgi:hypothetical protein